MRRAERRGERGSIAIELVLLTPVFIMFTLLVVACGRYVVVQGDVEAATRDAVRAASYERSLEAAQGAADEVARRGVEHASNCKPAVPPSQFERDTTITVEMTCRVSLDDLGLIGLHGTVKVTAKSAAHVDTYRRINE